MKKPLGEWLQTGEYLPEIMRDFHDAKDLFKAIHQIVAVEKHEYAKDVSTVVGLCYVVDIFLWFMAKHGYTLQKSRKKIDWPFDLREVVEECRKQRDDDFAKAFATLRKSPEGQEAKS